MQSLSGSHEIPEGGNDTSRDNEDMQTEGADTTESSFLGRLDVAHKIT